jgi:hypothetical protein
MFYALTGLLNALSGSILGTFVYLKIQNGFSTKPLGCFVSFCLSGVMLIFSGRLLIPKRLLYYGAVF